MLTVYFNKFKQILSHIFSLITVKIALNQVNLILLKCWMTITLLLSILKCVVLICIVTKYIFKYETTRNLVIHRTNWLRKICRYYWIQALSHLQCKFHWGSSSINISRHEYLQTAAAIETRTSPRRERGASLWGTQSSRTHVWDASLWK